VIHVGPYQALWLTERREAEAAGLHPVTQAARPAPAEPTESVGSQDRECPEGVRIFRRLSRPLYPVPPGLGSRGRLRLPVQAVLFDLYGTLWVSAAGDPESRDPSGSPTPPGLQELLERYGCPRSPWSIAEELAAAVRREQERLRGQGVDFPEVRIEEVWAGLLGLEDPTSTRAFAAEYEALVNPVWPMPGLSSALAGLRRQGLRLGILSNAQFYTPYLFECFLGADTRALGFRDELVLYSFELGLAKPSPRLFAAARGRLAAAGIRPGRVLLVGNDARTDLAPAREAGFQTVLFAGDARSLRGAEEAGAATAVIIALAELPRLL
jgi:putative hydrolase of the HAD superfamily